MLQELRQEPPNIAEIRAQLSPSKEAIFCYGHTVYNPSGVDIPEDVLWHEAVHEKQQVLWSTPDIWWTKYLFDHAFRLQQEVEAYAAQFTFIKEHYPYKARDEALFGLADDLCSPMYDLKINHRRAETMIRLGA